MSREFGDLHEGRVAPDDDLVLGVAVRGDELAGAFAPGQVTDLGARVCALKARTRQHIPEFDSSIGRSSSGCNEAVLITGGQEETDTLKPCSAQE